MGHNLNVLRRKFYVDLNYEIYNGIIYRFLHDDDHIDHGKMSSISEIFKKCFIIKQGQYN